MRLKNNGFTMIELVIASSVIAVMTLLMMNFVANRIADNARKNAQSELQLQTQLALDNINREIRTSANVDGNNRWDDTYAPIVGSPLSWASDADTLILANPTIDTSNNVIFDDAQAYISSKDDIIYYLANNTLYRRTLAAPVANNKRQTTCPPNTNGCPGDDALLAANVQNFSVEYFDANDIQVIPSEARAVKVTLRVSKDVFGKTLDVEESIRSVFRNE